MTNTRKNILITGASSGLGAGMAREFAARGRDLALCARRTERLESLKAELLAAHPGIRISLRELDVNQYDDVFTVFRAFAEEFGGLDRVIVKGKTVPAPVFTILHRANDDALAAHALFLQAKYAGELVEDDPRFDVMAAMIPELSGYYAVMRHDAAQDR